jgi:cyclopropane-fatty-acyl-phospholipid synthase
VGRALEAHKDKAIEIQSEEVYERYIKCLTGCAKMFRVGYRSTSTNSPLTK